MHQDTYEGMRATGYMFFRIRSSARKSSGKRTEQTPNFFVDIGRIGNGLSDCLPQVLAVFSTKAMDGDLYRSFGHS